MLSLAMTFLTSGSSARSSSIARKRDLVEALLLGFEPRRPRPQPVESLGDDGEVGLGDGVVEPHHHVAGLDEIAVVRAHLADHATGRVLHLS